MSMFLMSILCMNIDISSYKMRVCFCFMYNSTDFLIVKLTVLKNKDGRHYIETGRFLNHTSKRT